jgi:hypothetical protein
VKRNENRHRPEVYGQRVASVRAGFEFAGLMQGAVVMTKVRECDGKDAEAVGPPSSFGTKPHSSTATPTRSRSITDLPSAP